MIRSRQYLAAIAAVCPELLGNWKIQSSPKSQLQLQGAYARFGYDLTMDMVDVGKVMTS